MSVGGNGRARVFFKQHGWTDGGRLESKYVSRAADLYRQLLAKEVAKSVAARASFALPASLASDQPANGVLCAPDFDFFVESKQNIPLHKPVALVPVPVPVQAVPVACPTVSSGITRKRVSSLGAKKFSSSKVGGALGIRKLTTKVLG